MKSTFKLTLDQNNKVCVKFRHYDKDSSLDQKSLSIFIEAAQTRGLKLRRINSFSDMNGNSWENYEIQTNE